MKSGLREVSTPKSGMGLLPMPRRPRVISIDEHTRSVASDSAPVIPFSDGAVITDWLVRCPAPQGSGRSLAVALAGGKAATATRLLRQMNHIRPTLVLNESWPDITDAVDLHALGDGRPGIRSVFHAVLRVQRPVLVRVCHGTAGMNTSALMWISNREVDHGAIVRLGKGTHTVVMEVYHGNDGAWIKWNIARLAARFTVVSEKEIDEVHRWQLRQWEFTRDSAGLDESRLLRHVRIDPKTIRGREGFIRVGRSANGRWWLIDADGKPFYHRGSTGLNAGGIGGRRAGLPPVKNATVEKWIGILKKWRFNAMGAWTTSEFFDKGLPYTETIEGFYTEPWLDTNFPDVFDPRWAKNLEEKCRPICAAVKESRLLIGYFLENERGFMDFPGDNDTVTAKSPTYRRAGPQPVHGLDLPAEPKLNIRGIGLLQYCLSQKPGVPAGERAWQFVLKRHGTLKKMAQAWGIGIKGREDVRDLTAREEILISKSYLRDLRNFVALWVEQYYRVFTGIIRRHDPNHLILGMRHGGTPSPVTLAVEKRWTDIVSQNNYRAEFMEAFDRTYQACQTPILNGEFNTYTDSYNLVRNPIEPPGGHDAHTRWQIRGQTALDNIARHPGVVGYTMYRWHGSGNDDKLWNQKADRPNKPVSEELQRINYRSVPIAAESDRAPAKSRTPLHGQVFICLQDGVRHKDALPAAAAGGRASLLTSCAPVYLGLVCQRNRWDPVVYGEGIRGEVVRQGVAGDRFTLAIRIKSAPGIFSRKATAEYSITLQRDGALLRGRHKGRYDGVPTQGDVVGYLFRPVPTVNL